ncbi:globin domain-containing protein [Streptomyces sp. LP05-1]|uniref:nitric oxide dioxygenase n=1 Tax=Streptomyces pyxinae TaxID=2970734 RepID=A0ABT2CH35_9ACTN|nr:globin domain-containing protein [Streptomyces sp. LP05-1]MCS0636719.1 globin domain-containing protein [Streptomyces sp. LP05-1]
MDSGSGRTGDDYHALLARQDAMRLRRQLLAPGPGTGAGGAGPARRGGGPPVSPEAYDGGADQRVIVAGLPLVTPFGRLITHLYDAMFERHPGLRKLFPESMDFQRAHLEQAFWYLIERLHRPAEVAAFCARLGRDHRKLGVRAAHFRIFEDALAEALRRSAGADWSPELADAWLRMIRFATEAMVAGAEEAMGEPPYWNAEVTEVRRARDDLVVLRMRTAEPYPYRAGQYADLQSPLLPGAWRPYALASAPRSGPELEFHVRRAGRGGVSEALVGSTGVGDALRVGPPQGGDWALDPAAGPGLLLVAYGTGWATAKALLGELAGHAARYPVVRLLLAAGTPGELYDTRAPAALENRCPWLRVTPVTGPGPVSGGGRGRAVTGAVAEELVRQDDWSGWQAVVDGPPDEVAVTVRLLTALGVDADRIGHHLPAGTAVRWGGGESAVTGLPRGADRPEPLPRLPR